MGTRKWQCPQLKEVFAHVDVKAKETGKVAYVSTRTEVPPLQDSGVGGVENLTTYSFGPLSINGPVDYLEFGVMYRFI
jgi:hypothetical protein